MNKKNIEVDFKVREGGGNFPNERTRAKMAEVWKRYKQIPIALQRAACRKRVSQYTFDPSPVKRKRDGRRRTVSGSEDTDADNKNADATNTEHIRDDGRGRSKRDV